MPGNSSHSGSITTVPGGPWLRMVACIRPTYIAFPDLIPHLRGETGLVGPDTPAAFREAPPLLRTYVAPTELARCYRLAAEDGAPGFEVFWASAADTFEPAPFDPDLQRLSEILGALHFLRGICNSNEGQKWRNEAQTLIDAEAPNGDRHDQMIASFNRGYRGFAQSYRTCTPAAGVVIRRYLDEGANIARDITARYAN